MKNISLVVICPVYNEELVIELFHEKLSEQLNKLENVNSRILYVVDKSTDNTEALINKIVSSSQNARALILSSRFGHQMSLIAGIEKSIDADAIIMMDSDLQHPPELIPILISNFRNGIDVVYTMREDTQGVSFLRKIVGNLFYSFLNKISNVEVNPNAADFRLISKRVATVLVNSFPERNLFLRGLFTWIGFNQLGISYTAKERAAGSSKYSLSRMLKLALTGILSFSTKPLYIGIFSGCLFGVAALIMMLGTLANYFIDSSLPSGWTTLAILLLLFSALQLFVIGVLGIYIGGLYEEVKNRPRYIIKEEIKNAE